MSVPLYGHCKVHVQQRGDSRYRFSTCSHSIRIYAIFFDRLVPRNFITNSCQREQANVYQSSRWHYRIYILLVCHKIPATWTLDDPIQHCTLLGELVRLFIPRRNITQIRDSSYATRFLGYCDSCAV